MYGTIYTVNQGGDRELMPDDNAGRIARAASELMM
jgi:hypothetical protein